MSNADLQQPDIFDHVPAFVQGLLRDPPLMPGESQTSFLEVFASFLATPYGRAQTHAEYLKAYHVAVLTFQLARYERMEVAILRIQQRPAVESLLRRTHEGAVLGGAQAAASLKAMAHLDAGKYFANTQFKDRQKI
jgi:hypothetical protein